MVTRHSLPVRFLLFCCIGYVSCQKQELYEGSVCTLENGRSGICKYLKECPARIKEVQQGKVPTDSIRCSWDGFEEIVCCPQKLQGKIGVRPADLACQQYTNDIWADSLSFHILGGIEATAGEFPYMAALGFIDKDKLPKRVIQYNCGGTIIAANYVLTAAHCVKNIDNNTPVLVRAGAERLDDNAENAQYIRIAETIAHPRYSIRTVYNDIALLKLANPFKWTTTVKPICLMSKPVSEIQVSENMSLVVTGWGATDLGGESSNILLRTPSLNLVLPDECSKSYTKFRRVPDGLDDRTLCAIDGNSTRRADSCQGDSGGPLLMIDVNSDVIVGVTSFGQSCGSSTPAVYTSVVKFLDWIESHVWPDNDSD